MHSFDRSLKYKHWFAMGLTHLYPFHMKSPPIIKLTFNDTTFLSLRKRKDAISTIILKHVQYKRVNIPKLIIRNG